MSYTIYKNKAFIKVGKNKLIALICCSDNNCWEPDNKNHDWNWWPMMPKHKSLLYNIAEFNKDNDEFLKKEMQQSNEHDKKTATLETYCYYGHTYRGGGKYKHQKSFFSTKQLWNSVDEFTKALGHSFTILLYYYKESNWVKGPQFKITTETDLLNAEAEYQKLYIPGTQDHYNVIIYNIPTQTKYMPSIRKQNK